MQIENLLIIICITIIVLQFIEKRKNQNTKNKSHDQIDIINNFKNEINECELASHNLKQNVYLLNNQISMYKNLIELSCYAVAIYSEERRLTFYNDAFQKLWSFDNTLLNTQPLYDEILQNLIESNLIIDIDMLKYKNKQINYFSTLKEYQEDFLYLTDGRIIKTTIIPNSTNELLFAYEDITNKLIVERSYNQLIKIYKSIIEYIDEGATVFSANGKLYLNNQQYCKIFNLEQQYLNTKPHISDIFKKISKINKTKIDKKIINLFTHHINVIDDRLNTTSVMNFMEKELQIKIIYLPESLVLFLYSDK